MWTLQYNICYTNVYFVLFSEFQMRITRMTMTGQLETAQSEEPQAAKPRKALGALKTSRGSVTSIRSTSSSSKIFPQIAYVSHDSRMKCLQNMSKQCFDILQLGF